MGAFGKAGSMIARRQALMGVLATVFLVNCSKAATMEKPLGDKPSGGMVAALMARVKAQRMTIPELPREAMTGYPVPVLSQGTLFLAVPLFLRRGRPPAPPEVTAPGWIAYIDVPGGENFSWRKLDADLGPALGVHAIDPPLDMAGFQAAEAEMYAAMDKLLPLARTPDAPVPADLRGAADTFARRWRQLAHRPLAGHYRALNPQWFAKLGL